MDVSLELGLVVITESKVRLSVVSVLVILTGQIESENVALKKVLLNHLVENWGNSFLSQGWVSETNNGLEV